MVRRFHCQSPLVPSCIRSKKLATILDRNCVRSVCLLTWDVEARRLEFLVHVEGVGPIVGAYLNVARDSHDMRFVEEAVTASVAAAATAATAATATATATATFTLEQLIIQ